MICDGSGEDKTCSYQYWDLPLMILACISLDGSGNVTGKKAPCDHLTYMFNEKSILMDGSSCTNPALAVVNKSLSSVSA